jgi:hypothetical protein
MTRWRKGGRCSQLSAATDTTTHAYRYVCWLYPDIHYPGGEQGEGVLPYQSPFFSMTNNVRLVAPG